MLTTDSVASPRRVLVFRTGHLGDTVCAIPAFRLVRQAFPAAELTLLCDRPAHSLVSPADVVAPLGVFDRVRSYPSRRGWRSALALAGQVWRARPDLALVLSQGRETAEEVERKRRFLRRCGAGEVRAAQVLAAPHAWQPNEAERLLLLLRRMGVDGAKPPYAVPEDAAAWRAAQGKLRAAGLEADRPFLVFCGGGKVAVKLWPFDRYAAVLGVVAQQFGLAAVGVGTATERARYHRELAARAPSLVLPAEDFSLAELFEVCRRARAYLGNDTGPMHVAAAVACPVAAVFSARAAPGAWDPDVARRLVIRRRTFCEDCFLDECVAERHRCLRSISVAEVLAELVPFLREVMRRRTEEKS